MISDREAQGCRPDGADLFKLREWYRKFYLKTIWWEERRHRALEIACYQCESCCSTGALHVHHLSYHNLFGEPDGDLMVLCHDCHKTAHDDKFERETRGMTTEGRRKAIKKRCQKSQAIPEINFRITANSKRWRKK